MKTSDHIALVDLFRSCGYECKGTVTVFLPATCPPFQSPKNEAPNPEDQFCAEIRSSDRALDEAFARRSIG